MGSTAVSTVDIYNPTTNTYTTGPAMPSTRVDHGGAIGNDGRAYLFGGSTGWSASNSAVAFDFSTGRYTTLPSMTTARQGLTAAGLADGRVLAIGGQVVSGSYLSSVESYIIAANLWR